MPIIKQGEHACERCKKLFEWTLFEPYRNSASSSTYYAEAVPTGTLIHRYDVIDGKDIYEVNCPYCDFYNRFSE